MKLFISYSRDDSAFVYPLVQKLKEDPEYQVWIDVQIPGSTDWWESILSAVEWCDCCIVVLSQHSVASIYCEAELGYVHTWNKPILPLLHKQCTLPDVIQRNHIQYIDITKIYDVDRVATMCGRALLAAEREINKGVYPPPARQPPHPPVPSQPASDTRDPGELFVLAARAAKAGNLTQAEALYKDVKDLDPAGYGAEVDGRLQAIRTQTRLAKDYQRIADLVNEGLLDDAQAAFRVFLKLPGSATYGDPLGIAAKLNASMPITPAPQPVQLPIPQPRSTAPATPRITSDQQRLLDLMRDMNRPPQERESAGQQINEIGDPRPGVGLRSDGLPDIAWCEVPGGEFTMGAKSESDNPVRKVNVPTFYIAKYLITYRQFQVFIDARDGYSNADWWRGLHADGLNQQKGGAAEQNWKFDNHPRENVSWYEAMAFGRWLSAKLGYEITLPTEEQWEKAARGTDGREYPYRGEFDSNKGNTRETGIGQTSAVGIFTNGESPYHVLDMSGNVFQWTLTEYSSRQSKNISSSESRALRGASWLNGLDLARAACRDDYAPGGRHDNLGFRVCCSAPVP